jgi:hypothetical protein
MQIKHVLPWHGISVFALAASFGCASRPASQPTPNPREEQAVLAVVARLFIAMERRDTSQFGTIFLSGARLWGVRTNSQGQERLQSLTWEQFAAMNAGDQRGKWIERAWSPQVQIRGTMATVWAQYDFHFGSASSHCGVDAVQLLRIAGEWRIASIADTYETSGCPKRSPPGQ